MLSSVATREGRILCSPRDPLREAQRWIERQSRVQSKLPVIIVGIGAGFHVSEFAKQNPETQVYAFDLDPKMIENYQNNFQLYLNLRLIGPNDLGSGLPVFPYVFAFRAAWQGLESEFLSVYCLLKAETKESFLAQARDLGIQTVVNFKSQEAITIKSVGALLEGQSCEQEEVKIWKCLRELVR
ncbi:MAG: hypothetical protein BroJett040_05340 [Oligoflexia bacterium]|nr:MAG: hypothetical protein BroJett040_05340 [Oligoflexia bacterium]